MSTMLPHTAFSNRYTFIEASSINYHRSYAKDC